VVSGQRAGGIHNEERERKRDFIEEEKQNSVSAATATAKRSYMYTPQPNANRLTHTGFRFCYRILVLCNVRTVNAHADFVTFTSNRQLPAITSQTDNQTRNHSHPSHTHTIVQPYSMGGMGMVTRLSTLTLFAFGCFSFSLG